MPQMFMDAGYPDEKDFSSAQIKTIDFEHHWDRDPGSGGKNYGKDFNVPDGSVVIGYHLHTISNINVKNGASIYVVSEGDGPFRPPTGVHVGCRLEPGGFGGPGASFKFSLTIQTVSKLDWMTEFSKQL